MTEILFWIFTGLIFYAYAGYTLLLFFISLVSLRLWKREQSLPPDNELPEVTLLIAAYNERDIVDAKMDNTSALDYPGAKLKVLWVTDGSDDGTPELLAGYEHIQILHEPGRAGKTAALNRAVPFIDSPVTVFCDANTMLDPMAIRHLVAPFKDGKVGCVAGEKRILKNSSDTAAGTGEGTYWQYEAVIKRLESNCFSALAAAGELYAIRTKLFVPVPEDTIIDDFCISLGIATQGYRIRYAPTAFATETASANIQEELKRKIRIASGGFQTISRMHHILNFFRYGFLSFEFFSHKLLRWAFVPFALPLVLILNIILVFSATQTPQLYLWSLLLQGVFYLLVILGVIFESRSTRLKFFFLPYYLIVINYAQIAGLIRYLGKKQSAAWEKARRSA